MADSKKDETAAQPAVTLKRSGAGRRNVAGAWIVYEPEGTGTHNAIGVYADRVDAMEAALSGEGPITAKYVFVPWGQTLAQALQG
jgi:hypothetical protein